MAEDEPYYLATRKNLLSSLSDPADIKLALADVGSLKIDRVLDVGSGIGQALFPFLESGQAFGVASDLFSSGLIMGREFYAKHLPQARITFVRATGELLPFAAESFDLVNCGLAIMYMRNARALAEVARVLRPGGVFLLKIHHARYYVRELWKGVSTGNPAALVNGAKVLFGGTVYHLVRKQLHWRFLNETYQTRWLLRSELAKHSMVIERERTITNPLTPAFVIRKK